MAKTVDYWRGYFSGANSDICEIIENAVIVAALDHPKEFMLKRDHIVELLYTSQVTKCRTKCSRCERGAKHSGPKNGADGARLVEGEKFKSSGEFEEKEKEKKGKERKVNSCDDDGHVVKVTYKDAEDLNDQIERAARLIEEVVRIKDIIDNRKQSESMLLGSLRRLELLDLSVQILKATEIGLSVKRLKNHGSKKIRDLAHTLLEGWLIIVDLYLKATAAATEVTSAESMKTYNIDSEVGLPSPPLEEGAFCNHSLELTDEFFDDIDEDGNLKYTGDVNKNRGSGRKHPLKDGNVPKHKQHQLPNGLISPLQKNKVQQTMKEETVMKKRAANKPPSASTRPITTRAEQKVNNQTKSQLGRDARAIQMKPFAHQVDISPKFREQQSANGAIRKKPLPPQKEKLKSSEDAKTEATKRKVQELYQEAENAKKKRINQVTPLHDITKQGAVRNHLMKPGHSNYNRHLEMYSTSVPTKRHSTGLLSQVDPILRKHAFGL